MNEEIKREILGKIEEYDSIVICRHLRPDGDAVGSTLGLAQILRNTYPEKKVYVINDDYSDYLNFLGYEDDEIDEEEYERSLMIVLDTATADRISNSNLLKAKEVIKIDHHIEVLPYGNISWVEDFRSSLCEQIVDFYVTFKDKLIMDAEAAYCLYTGMMTDSGRFKYSASGETLRLAAVLLDFGIDTEEIYAHLYLQDYDYLISRAAITHNIRITQNGVAYLYITELMKKQYNLSNEDASNMVSMLDSIKDSLIWLAFIEYPDGSIRVRLRSRFVTVNKLAEKYGGGGHDRASGATVHSKKEYLALLNDADALLKEYKENNEGWL